MDTYASLLNRKLIVLSETTDYAAVDLHYWKSIFCPELADIPVDEAWYLRQYPDVADAIARKNVESAAQHFREFGYFEHRMPYRIEVDEAWYLQQYEDVRAAVARRVFASAQQHFETAGFREGRLPFAGFTLRSQTVAINRVIA